MKPYIYHYPRRRNYKHAAIIVSMWIASAALMAVALTQLFNLAK